MIHTANQYTTANHAMITDSKARAWLIDMAAGAERYFDARFHPALINPNRCSRIDYVHLAETQFPVLADKYHGKRLDDRAVGDRRRPRTLDNCGRMNARSYHVELPLSTAALRSTLSGKLLIPVEV